MGGARNYDSMTHIEALEGALTSTAVDNVVMGTGRRALQLRAVEQLLAMQLDFHLCSKKFKLSAVEVSRIYCKKSAASR